MMTHIILYITSPDEISRKAYYKLFIAALETKNSSHFILLFYYKLARNFITGKSVSVN